MFRFSFLLFPVPERQSPDSKSQRDEAEQMNIFSKKQLSSQCSQLTAVRIPRPRNCPAATLMVPLLSSACAYRIMRMKMSSIFVAA